MTRVAGSTAAVGAQHPIIERLKSALGCVEVDAAGADAFTSTAGDAVLFFCGDPKLFPEALDVAVILPELAAHFAGRFRVGIVAWAAQKALQARYRVVRLPALVFLRGGEYVGVIAGVRGWDEYLQQIEVLLATAPGELPVLNVSGRSGCRTH